MSERGQRVESDKRRTIRDWGMSLEPAILFNVWIVLLGPYSWPVDFLNPVGYVKRRPGRRVWVFLPYWGEHLRAPGPAGPEARSRRAAYEAWCEREGVEPYDQTEMQKWWHRRT